MDLGILGTFLDAARAGSFAAAARLNDIDPSLVSRRISTLEQALGFRLFQRTTRTISLTEAGAEFLKRIQPHVQAIEEARLAARDLNETPTGTLRVTASTTFGYEILTPLLPGFRESAPDVRLELMLTDTRINLIEEGVDLAIRLGSLPDSEFVARKIMPIRFRVYASPHYLRRSPPIEHPSALNEVDCLTYPTGRYRDHLVVSAENDGVFPVSLKGAVTISNALSLKRCACLGMAPAFLPNWLVRDELARGELVDLFPACDYSVGPEEEAAWFVYPSRLYVPLKVRRFMTYVTARIGERSADSPNAPSTPSTPAKRPMGMPTSRLPPATGRARRYPSKKP